jgi:hypothetical protein
LDAFPKTLAPAPSANVLTHPVIFGLKKGYLDAFPRANGADLLTHPVISRNNLGRRAKTL